MAVDERKVIREAIAQCQQEYHDLVVWLIQTYGQEMVRRGAQALLQPRATAASLREERQYFATLEGEEFEQAIAERVARTSWQETIEMLTGGRKPRLVPPPEV